MRVADDPSAILDTIMTVLNRRRVVARFSADMLIKDAMAAHPNAPDVFARHGLACGVCMASEMESLAAAAAAHDVPLQTLLLDLDMLISDEAGTES